MLRLCGLNCPTDTENPRKKAEQRQRRKGKRERKIGTQGASFV